MTPSQGQQDTVCPGSVRNSSPLWRLSSPCPLEAGAATAPLGWSQPLMCPSRSGSVIFHCCSWSNVSVLPTFEKVCSPWHQISSPQSLFGIYRRGSNLERAVAKRELSNLFFVSPIVPHPAWHFFHSSPRTFLCCKWSIPKILFFKVLKDPQHPPKARKCCGTRDLELLSEIKT